VPRSEHPLSRRDLYADALEVLLPGARRESRRVPGRRSVPESAARAAAGPKTFDIVHVSASPAGQRKLFRTGWTISVKPFPAPAHVKFRGQGPRVATSCVTAPWKRSSLRTACPARGSPDEPPMPPTNAHPHDNTFACHALRRRVSIAATIRSTPLLVRHRHAFSHHRPTSADSSTFMLASMRRWRSTDAHPVRPVQEARAVAPRVSHSTLPSPPASIERHPRGKDRPRISRELSPLLVPMSTRPNPSRAVSSETHVSAQPASTKSVPARDPISIEVHPRSAIQLLRSLAALDRVQAENSSRLVPAKTSPSESCSGSAHRAALHSAARGASFDPPTREG